MDEEAKELIREFIAVGERIAEAIEDIDDLIREDMGIVSLEDVEIEGKPN